MITRFAALLTIVFLLGACASEEAPQSGHVSYGPSNTLFTSPDGRPEHYNAGGSFAPTDEHYRAATPGPFRGY